MKVGQLISLCKHNCHCVLAAPCLNRREIFKKIWFVHYVYTLSHISHGSFQLYESLWRSIWLALKRYKIQGSCFDLPLVGCWAEGILSRGLHFTWGTDIVNALAMDILSYYILQSLGLANFPRNKYSLLLLYSCILAHIVFLNICYQPFLIIFYKRAVILRTMSHLLSRCFLFLCCPYLILPCCLCHIVNDCVISLTPCKHDRVSDASGQ